MENCFRTMQFLQKHAALVLKRASSSQPEYIKQTNNYFTAQPETNNFAEAGFLLGFFFFFLREYV